MSEEKPAKRKADPSEYEAYVDPIGVTFWLPPKCKNCSD